MSWVEYTLAAEEVQAMQKRGATPLKSWVCIDRAEVVRLIVSSEASGPGGLLETQVQILATSHGRRRLPTEQEEVEAEKCLQLEVIDRTAIERGEPQVVLFCRPAKKGGAL